HAVGLSSRGCLARPPSGLGPVFWLLTSDSPLYLSGYRPDVSISRVLLLALASSGILLSNGIRLAPTPWGDRPPEGRWRLLRSQFPWLASVGRCSPPGFVAVQTGQYRRLPAPYPVPFWLQRVSLLRWFAFTMALYTFAYAAHRCLRDGIPRVRLPGSAVYPRFRPLRTSRRPGGYACTPAPGGRDLHPHGELSYKVDNHLAVCPEAEASFRPTGRTSMKAVLICQPCAANTCCIAASVPNTTRCLTLTRRRRRVVFTTWAYSSAGMGIQRGFGVGPVAR